MSAKKTAITVASAAAFALVMPAVKKSEGYWPTVKVDKVGTGGRLPLAHGRQDQRG
jgi:hypothetical protein